MADGHDLDSVLAAAVHHPIGADHDLADVVSLQRRVAALPSLHYLKRRPSAVSGDGQARNRERRERSYALQKMLEPLERCSRVVLSYVGNRLVDLIVGEWRPDNLHLR